MLRVRFFVGVLVALAIFAVPLATSRGTSGAEDVDPTTFDAMGYASHTGVSLEEAERRLRLQGLAGALDAELSERESQTFAGLWIEHTPQYRIVVQFTQDAQAKIASYVNNDELTEVIEARTADVSLTDLRAAQSKAIEAIAAENIPIDTGIDIKTGRVKVYVVERDRLSAAIKRGNVTLPATVDIETVPTLSRLNADIYGGLPEDEGTPTSSETNDRNLLADIHFPQVREDGDVPTAEIEGELVLEGSCLRVKPPDGRSHLLIWPQRVKLTAEKGVIQINSEAGVLMSVGDYVHIGGGQFTIRRHIQGLVENPISDECLGPYWFVGDIPGLPWPDP